MRRHLVLILLLAIPILASAQAAPAPDPVLVTMRGELERSLAVLKKQPVPPYFVSYELTDNRGISVNSSFGALTGAADSRTRLLDVDLRVGSAQRDNTHQLRQRFSPTTFGEIAGAIPIDNDPEALAMGLWLETDRHYRNALQRFEAVKAEGQIKTANTDKSDDDNLPDFSSAPAETYLEPIADFSFDRAAWEERVRRYGKVFASLPDIQSADVSASGEIETRRYVNSDGSQIRMSSPFYRLDISVSIKAADGEILPLYRTYAAFHPDGLPSDAEIMRVVEQMKTTLLALQKAPVADAYTGPAILSGRASAVFFHEIFGHRIEGDRLKDDDDAQTFKKKIGEAVLPSFLSVYSDPTLRRFGNTDLVGYYPYDDEGVKARRVAVVEKGIFRSFLLSRSPLKDFPSSNAHGRRQQGYDAESRQSNLLVDSSTKVSRDELKKLLLERVKAGGKPYGLLIDDITGGFTLTSRALPNSFAVLPTVVYRVYPDGREELVRGLDMIGTPLIAFSKISATDNDIGVFNGLCGAESGWVPVSAVAPGMLIDQIEVQRKEKSQAQNPILPPPPMAEGK